MISKKIRKREQLQQPRVYDIYDDVVGGEK